MGIQFNARTNAIETDANSIDFTQPITTPASTTSLAGLNIAEGVAPSAPVDGDVWVTAAGEFFARLNGVSTDLSAGGGGSIGGSITDNQIAVGATTADDIEGSANLTYDATTLTISTGILPSAPALELTNARPVLVWDETDAAADNGRWYMHASAETFELVAINDANSVSEAAFTVNRTGTTIDSVAFNGTVTADNISGTNTGDQTITLTGDVTGTGTGSFATTIAAGAVDVAMLANGTDGELITWSATGVATTVATGTATHVLTSNGPGTAPTFQAPSGGGNVSNTGTPVNNQLAVWTDATTIEGDASLTYDGSSFAAYGDGTAPDNHYLGLDASNRYRFECGANYGVIHYEDDNVAAETRNFYYNIQSSATGDANFWWRLNGGDTVQFDVSNGRFVFAGAIEFTESSDHAATLNSGRTQIWAKSRSLDPELMVSTGDSSNDHTLTNVIELSYHFDTATTAADPGAGDIRFNNATPASVTNLYVDDVESTGRDSSFMLANLANGDAITIRNQTDEADYMVVRVDGTPTDNTGYWTIPVTVIHSGTLPAGGDPLHITVDWLSHTRPLNNWARKNSDESTTTDTTLSADTDLVVAVPGSGIYEVYAVLGMEAASTTPDIKWGIYTTSYDTNVAQSEFVYHDADNGTVGHQTPDALVITALTTAENWISVQGIFRITGSTNIELRWAQNTSSADATRVLQGSYLRVTEAGRTSTATSGDFY
jgi:hypothetical protein